VADDAPLTAADICWTLSPIERLETADVSTEPGLLLQYLDDLQRETSWLRLLLSEALTRVHALTSDLDRSRIRIDALISELRAAQADCRELRAEQRRQQEAS